MCWCGWPAPALVVFNLLGKVLVMENGDVITDSRVIVEYFDTLSPVGKLLPTVGRERAEVNLELADGVLDAAILGAAGSHLERAR